jgi:ribonuclease-3
VFPFKIKPFRFYLSGDKHFYEAIKNIFGFYPGNIFLYKLAFLHKSQSEEMINGMRISNERLEFLGDTVLSTVVADYLFRMFPYKDEGFLTEMRSKIVSRAQLNKLSFRLGIDQLIIHAQNNNSVFRSIKGDALEALIGAIYLDKGYRFTRKVLINRVIKNHFDLNVLIHTDVNHKSKIIEWAQKEKKPVEFNVIQEVGTGYKKQYIVEIRIAGKPSGSGRDYSIKGAEQQAAMKAIELFDLNNHSLVEK